MDFEKRLGRLEDIVEKMETGELSLEDSLKLFEEGVKLSRESFSRRLAQALRRRREALARVYRAAERSRAEGQSPSRGRLRRSARDRRLLRPRRVIVTELLEARMKDYAQRVGAFLDAHFTVREPEGRGLETLFESVRYSALQPGAKRFRPVLAMMTAEALGQSPERVTAFAAAIECIHTYSLIHDDLPAMDDDDFRRGMPTNHKKFGEATAILAGDALLTEAFNLIASQYELEPALAVRVVRETAKAAGQYGMVGGQAIDIRANNDDVRVSLDELRNMHAMKTGALIRVSAVGAAILCGADERRLRETREFAAQLGLAFQVADDLLDYEPAKPEPGSYPALLGPKETRAFLAQTTRDALSAIEAWPETAAPLRQLAEYNLTRTS